MYLLKVSIQVPPCRHGFVTQGLGTDEKKSIAVRCEIQWTCMKQTTISIVIMLSTKQRDHYIMEVVIITDIKLPMTKKKFTLMH